MKANESIPNYDIKVREYTNYAIKSIKNVCKSFGPRPVGSEAEKNAQEYMKADLEKFCDDVKREEYKCSDKAFMSWVIVGATLMLLNMVLFTLGISIGGLALTLLTAFFIVGEFIFYKPVLDGFFKKVTSGNVYGVRKASGETKKRIILVGHTDSAFEWTYTYNGGRPVVATIIFGSILSIIISLVANIYSMIHFQGVIGGFVWSAESGIVIKVMAVLMYLTAPILIVAYRFCNFKNPVIGANDNLTGCFISYTSNSCNGIEVC